MFVINWKIIFYVSIAFAMFWVALLLGPSEAFRPLEAYYVPPLAMFIFLVVLFVLWGKFGKAYWVALAANLRRGIARIYLTVTAVWLVRFGFKAFYDASDSYRGNFVERDLLFFILGPLVPFFIFIVLSWIIDGFKRQAGSEDTDTFENIKRDHQRTILKTVGVSPDVQTIFGKLKAVLESDDAQVQILPEPIRTQVATGKACDTVLGASGEFGRDINNPIPVNGPLGELVYISQIITIPTRVHVMFHRLGSLRNIDIYEIVSQDAMSWDFLFLDMYHPRKSKNCPIGYEIAKWSDKEPFITGTNEYVNCFPDELPEFISKSCGQLLNFRLRAPNVSKALASHVFIRPPAHVDTYNELVKMIEAAG